MDSLKVPNDPLSAKQFTEANPMSYDSNQVQPKKEENNDGVVEPKSEEDEGVH